MIKSKSIKILEYRKISIQIPVNVPLWSFLFIGYAKDKEVGLYFLQQCCARLREMIESERELKWKLLSQTTWI